MRAAARAPRISHSNMLTSPGRVASAGHWCPSAVMHYAFIRRARFSVTAPTYGGGSVSRSSLVTAAMRPSCGRVNAGEAPIDLSTEGGLLESGAIFGRHF